MIPAHSTEWLIIFEKEEYATVLGDVKKVIEDSDYSIVNLECPITKGNEMTITKYRPNIRCSDKGVKALKWVRYFHTIEEAKERADHVIVIVHGGHELYQLSSPGMQEIYHFFIDIGADVVVNHHQYCFSGFEIYHDKPIFYGLGNFCFDNGRGDNQKWNEDYIVLLRMNAGISFDIIPYNQCSELAYIKVLEKNSFNEELKKLNTIICDSTKLKTATERYFESCI